MGNFQNQGFPDVLSKTLVTLTLNALKKKDNTSSLNQNLSNIILTLFDS